MKVIHVSESDKIGGAAVAAFRLNGLLNTRGTDSCMIVSRKMSNEKTIIAPSGFLSKSEARLKPHLYIQLNRILYGSNLITSRALNSSLFLLKQLHKLTRNIVHLHWVNNGFLKLEDIVSIKGPIIWTLHDTWLFTAGCHSSQGCTEFLANCSTCPKVFQTSHQSLLDKQFLNKQQALNLLKDKITVTVPSGWMKDSAEASTLLSGFDIRKIPNVIETDTFTIKNKFEAKKRLGLETGRKYFTFGASDPIGDTNKGFEYLKTLLNDNEFNDYSLLVFGRSTIDQEKIGIKIPVIFLGAISDETILTDVYNASEVVLMPSIHESFGQVAAEAMACGVPVLAFKTTGLVDIIDHMENGYLAKLKDIEDLKHGLKWILAHADNDALKLTCRDKIVREFCPDVICSLYTKLYQEKSNVE